MPAPATTQPPSRLLGTALALIALATVLWPGAAVVWTIAHGALENLAPRQASAPRSGGSALETLPPLSLAPSIPLLAQTLAWALGIAILSTLLAWPAAWVIRRRGWGVVGLLCVPLMLPTYLCYTAYGILRSPGWFVGNWLEELAKAGWTTAPIIAGRVIAALGLSLWSWPIAAIVLGASVRRLDQSVLDALRLETSATRRRAEILWLSRAGIAGGIGAVSLVMIGSAVPLHLSQVPTYAIKIWLDLTLAPGSWRVWAAAWPLLAIAVVAGWLIGSRLLRDAATSDEPDTAPTPARQSATPATTLTALNWTASVLIPLALFAVSLSIVNRNISPDAAPPQWRIEPAFDQWRAVPRFFTLAQDPLAGSLLVAAAVGAISLVITCTVWQGLSTRRRAGLVMFCARAFLIAGIIPGVLVGSALSLAANATDATSGLADSPWIVVLGHTARFGFVPALIGCWLAAIEPRQERDLRALDGALNFKGWAGACLPVQAGALVAAALAAAALSLHEIESAVVLQPPGSPSLAQLLLNDLHQLRMQDLSAAGVVLVAGGLFVAGLAALGTWWTARQYKGMQNCGNPM
jgi:ABC-type Fe3+ transport system permease subunit